MAKPLDDDSSCAQQKESEEEWITLDEQIVHVELTGLYQDDILSKFADGKGVQFSGLETSEPVLQIGHQVFAGNYVDAVGTSVFIRCREGGFQPLNYDPVFQRELPKTTCSFECMTNKKLLFKRVFLKPKNPREDVPRAADDLRSKQ